MKYVKIVITDLDDTIWDWLTMWYSSFYPYLKNIETLTEINITDLKNNFKHLHQKYHSCESSFIYNDLCCLSDNQKNRIDFESNSQISILHQYYRDKKNNLKMYESVLEALEYIKSRKTILVGFTESNSFFTKQRLKHLGLDGLFDCIYSPEDFQIPDSVTKVYNSEHWEPKKTKFVYLDCKMKKPDHKILLQIIHDYNLNVEDAIYIGDKPARDILMANDANVTSIYARYGHIIEDHRYDLLRDVTHWTDEEVVKEIELKKSINENFIKPSYTIDKFCDILNYFEI